ncbi:MAG: hypothetical protein IGR76_06650 [Synechococcales cyanobacterium T60_A2020_003]|nr:hypothetical protein [Synechococcales cyanobacterium T60_A2020_003]
MASLQYAPLILRIGDRPFLIQTAIALSSLKDLPQQLITIDLKVIGYVF